ncbi:MAG: type I-C CRISPR-associated protein Cas8c/Csd1 [Provencibacterium sp.]|jgi:CRISPR-associated protein Csd1|nr:type I-C CRISPR-associated protein Cas8c/Csd1 [Provencibacterium sp.]
MILRALVEYYETLARQGKVLQPGWGEAKISYALCIDEAGRLERLVSLKRKRSDGKSAAMEPTPVELPAPVKRTLGIAPNFLWDNAGYLLGMENKGGPGRSRACFAASRELHKAVLSHTGSPAAQALLSFFEGWDPETAFDHPALQGSLESLLAGANLAFLYQGAFLQEDPEIRRAWQDYYHAAESGGEAICLVTGDRGSAQPVHPPIKGVAGALPAGAALVSFNAPAFCSYGREQSLNAPISRYAAFAYAAALNRLTADEEHLFRIGDMTVVFWAENGQTAYSDLFRSLLLEKPEPYLAIRLQKIAEDLREGRPAVYEEARLDPAMGFHVLGLSPNAARLSVRLFLRDAFGRFVRNLERHQERLRIARPFPGEGERMPLGELLEETVRKNARTPSPIPEMAGETLRAILDDSRYPATLLHSVEIRIRAEREVTPGRAAILKAYYLKNPDPGFPKEVLKVGLNAESSNIPYTLGRLFSELETIQSAAEPGARAGMKRKYWGPASTTPNLVFPILMSRAQQQLEELDEGTRSRYDGRLAELAEKLGESYPARMNLPQQGAFQLGYYHQVQARSRERGGGRSTNES